MSSDDLTAFGGICAGALVSAALTFVLMTGGPLEGRLRPGTPALSPAPSQLTVPPRTCIGSAVPRVWPIRMVAPETRSKGWDPRGAAPSPRRERAKVVR